MARSLPSTIGGVTVVDFEIGPSKSITTLQDAWTWIYTNYPNLVSANRIVRGIVTGMTSQSVDTISVAGTITSDATRYVMFVAALGEGLCDTDPSTTPLYFNSSKAGFQSTAGTARPGFMAPAQYSGHLYLEGLQFRCNADAGDQRGAIFHSGLHVHSRSNVYMHDKGFGVGGSCMMWSGSIKSYNDVFIYPFTGYVSAMAPVKATTVNYVQELHNPTMWGAPSGNFGIGGIYDGANAAPGSRMENVLILNTETVDGVPSDWNPKNIATSASSASGTSPITNLVAADTLEVNTEPADVRLKSTATSVKDGGFNNLDVNPVDFYFRERDTVTGYNIGAHDPDASAGDPPTISITDMYPVGNKIVIEYDWTSAGSGTEITVGFLIDGVTPVGPFTSSSVTGTYEYTASASGVYSVFISIEDSIGEDTDASYVDTVEMIGLEGEGEGEGGGGDDILTLVPSSATIVAGDSVNLTLTVEDDEGNPIVGVSPSIFSSNPGVATATLLDDTDSNGEAIVEVTGVGSGITNVYATYNSVNSNNSAITVVKSGSDKSLNKRINAGINLRIN